jgi:DNA-binding transcriptional ArsR family regulator
VPVKTEEAYHEFFNSDEFDKLFEELIVDKLVLSQIMSLLSDKPRLSGEISGILGLSPSEVSRHLKVSAKRGLARYDVNSRCYAPA